MLELLIKLTDDLSTYDLAALNFWLSWAGALSAVVLMIMLSQQRTLRTPAGRIAWLRTCVVFWTTIMLVLGGSYPVHLGAQPWLPSVLLTATVLLWLIVSILTEAQRDGRLNRSLARRPA